jgi:hypothetical protein
MQGLVNHTPSKGLLFELKQRVEKLLAVVRKEKLNVVLLERQVLAKAK